MKNLSLLVVLALAGCSSIAAVVIGDMVCSGAAFVIGDGRDLTAVTPPTGCFFVRIGARRTVATG